jgi:ABC-type transport system substrate-binding protein
VDLEVELLIPLNKESTYRHDVAENIRAQLLQCGITVNIVEAETAENANDYLQRLQSGNFELALCSFYLDDYPDISYLVGTGGRQNYGGFSDATLDELLASCNSALDENAMMAAYAAMEQRFIETVPQIGLYFKTNALLYDTAIAISKNIRDLNLYTTLPQWYLYVKNAAGEAVPIGAMASSETSATPAADTSG